MSTRIPVLFARLRWAVALLLLAWGLFLFDTGSWKWMIANLVVFAFPLACQLTRVPWLRIASLWLGLLVAIQCTFPHFAGNSLRKNAPNEDFQIDADGTIDLAGVHGLHRHRTDAEGYRVTSEIDYARKSALRIFALGASTTACDYLDDAKTWPGLLEKKLRARLPGRPLEVINAGIAGTGITNHYAMTRDILRHRPDLVVFLLGVNDWNRQIKHALGYSGFYQRETIKLKYSPLSLLLGRLLLPSKAPEPVPSAAVANIRNPDEMRAQGGKGDPYAGLRGSLKREPKYEYRPERVSREFARYLEKIGALCKDTAISCVFLTAPSAYSSAASEELKASYWMTPFFEPYTVSLESMIHMQTLYNDHLRGFGERNGLPVLDVAAKVEPSFANFYDDVHFNEGGAERVAEALTAFLLERPALLAAGRVVGAAP